ncbi:MAG: peptidoglycan DD-metalloendopeptidase family protein [Bdellovibrionota bacterium]
MRTIATPVKRAEELSRYIEKEREQFVQRETKRREVLDQLDRINKDQNRLREGLANFENERDELNMSLENLRVEVENQKAAEAAARSQLSTLLRILYQVERDGLGGFLLQGESLGKVYRRIRVFSQSVSFGKKAVARLQDRSERLATTEKELEAAKKHLEEIIARSSAEREQLNSALLKKERALTSIRKKQQLFKAAEKEYEKVSAEVQVLFKQLDAKEQEKKSVAKIAPKMHNIRHSTLPLPVEGGRLVREFGKRTNEEFKTVTLHKGLEIEAPIKSPVFAVLPGIVEFEGWIKGMGNVVIIHHGDGFYTLSGHLYKISAAKGSAVKPGDVIGLVGDTGRNDKPSLYFEVRENADAVDPMPYFLSDEVSKIQIADAAHSRKS